MEKIKVFALLLLCVALLTVCKAEEEMEMEGQEDHKASVEKRALPECLEYTKKGLRVCNKHTCRCPEGEDCVNGPSSWKKTKVCRNAESLPACLPTEDCKKGVCKCEEGKGCGKDPHATGMNRFFANMVCV